MSGGEDKRNLFDPGWKKITMSIQWKKESKREREIDTRVETRIVFIDINAQTTRRRGGEAVSRPRRKVQSTDAQRCIGNAPIRGLRSGPICSVHERGGREGGRTKETRGFPGTEHHVPL